MSGWRDESGRTASERKKAQRSQGRARFADTLRKRPAALVKPVISALFIGVLVIAVFNFLV
ncbi:MAG: hypothetical protein JNL81_06350 [Hyphomonadaceae bacterium]|nr:hypothetical protein [Hyphomonadaceae bacterium]